jgi:uncharacterized membrane protein
MPVSVPELFYAALTVAIGFLEAASTLAIVGGAGLAILALGRRRDLMYARQLLSNSILLGLDLAIGADIIKVAANPSLATVLVVGGVVVIRIALTLMIVWELRLGRPVPDQGGDVRAG